MRLQLSVPALAVVALLTTALQSAEPLTLGSLFTDHGVFQRDLPVPVWGKAEPGREVVVQFAGQEKRATADKNGRWMAKLDPMAASASGQTLTVKTDADGAPLTRQDLLVGEVWICSGQSNMAWDLRNSNNGAETIAAAGDPQLRLFGAGAHATDEPQESIGGTWEIDSPQSSAGFSAVGYFFGQDLRKKLNVPVGLIRSSVGGTLAEAWTSRSELERNPTLNVLLVQQAARVADFAKALEDYKQHESELLAKYEEALAKAKAEGKPDPGKPEPPKDDPKVNGNRPTGLYNGSIAPLEPYAIRGAIWYQGESNAGAAKLYQTLFPAMIASWRKAWGQGDFPFLFVQIAPHNNMPPEIREAQRVTSETTPGTAMAVITDVGDAVDIHPRAKQPVGQRLALAARALAYGEPIEYSGPTLDGLSVAGNRAILTFKHLGGGLVAKDGELKGFAIAGADGNFVPAKATIEGETVVVTSDAVAAPAAVRYGWAHTPDVNLYNKAGLPASPFQTEKIFELEPGFELIFNGKDLTGWHYDAAPFDGQTQASDGRYTARDGRIVVNPGKGTAQLRTTREFPHNFTLKLEFRAGVDADSGIFVRGPQLQCRDYLVAGPFKDLKNYKPQDWNEIEVVVRGDSATCTCNGEPLKFDDKLPATGPIGLEADRGQMEYRRIRIKETP
jgi:sialate O-acetylesterase